MTERESERVRSTDAESDAGSDAEGRDANGQDHDRSRTDDLASTIDRQVDSFFDVNETVSTDAEPAIGGGRAHARIVEAELVPASEAPAEYPWELRTETVLALTVEFPGGTQAVVYVEHRENGQDPRFARILEVIGTPYGSYADLYGERLLMEVVDGYWVPYVPRRGPRGSPLGVYGVWFGLVFNVLALLGIVLSGGWLLLSAAFWLAFLLINLLVIPSATLTDAWYLESHTDWEHGPLFWASCNAFPVLNVPVSVWYLGARSNVRHLEG